MQPGGQGDYRNPNGIHEATVSLDGSKVYLAYGTGANGVIRPIRISGTVSTVDSAAMIAGV